MNEEDKKACYITKIIDTGNQGFVEVRYSIRVEGADGMIDDLTYIRLEQLLKFLTDYVKRERREHPFEEWGLIAKKRSVFE